jgi:hypothetical protein
LLFLGGKGDLVVQRAGWGKQNPDLLFIVVINIPLLPEQNK